MRFEASQLRKDQEISLNEHPYIVTQCFPIKPEVRRFRGQAFVKLASLIQGRQARPRYPHGEMVEAAHLERHVASSNERDGDDLISEEGETNDKPLLPSGRIDDEAAELVEAINMEVCGHKRPPVSVRILN
jgi:translation elongation factor P/translation initiation factor 5A